MSDAITPALTAEEWEREVNSDYGWTLAERVHFACDEIASMDRVTPHALAALALYGQPFGFSDVDSAKLRTAARMLREANDAHDGAADSLTVATAAFLESLATRIAALLPPA